VSDLLLALAAALVGGIGGGGGVLGYLAWRGDTVRNDFERLHRLHTACEEKVTRLEGRLEAVEHAQDSHLARWTKDSAKRLTWMNDKAYMTIFAPLGITREAADGKTFAELLIDRASAAEIDRLDQAALAQPDSPVSNLVRLHPDLPLMHVVKVASTGKLGALCYEGYAFRVNDRDLDEARGVGRARDARAVSADRMIPGGGD
jgi:hypothetical protein